MFFRNIVPALAGLTLAAAVPASVERDAAGILHRREDHGKRDNVIIQQTVIEPQVIVVNENLAALDALALEAEQEFAALIQSQLILINTVETIKDNIRINHFKTRWNTVNTVIVVVTNVVDARDPSNLNTRYMVNQIQADNNNPGSEILVMMTAASALTIQPEATPTNLNIPGVTGVGQSISQPTSQPQVAQLDPESAFAQAANGAVLLPFDSSAPQPPSGAQLFADPASIILPNQALFVGDVALIQQDAALLAAGSLFNLQSQLLAQQAIAQAELAGVVLGSAPPPTIIINAGDDGQQSNGQQISGQQINGQQSDGQQNDGQQNDGQQNNGQQINGQQNSTQQISAQQNSTQQTITQQNSTQQVSVPQNSTQQT